MTRWRQLASVTPAILAVSASCVAVLRFGLYFHDVASGDAAWLLVDLSMSILLAGWGSLRVWPDPRDGIGYLLQCSGLAWALACLADTGPVQADAWDLFGSDAQLVAHLVARSLLVAAAVVVLPDRSADRFMRRGPLDAFVAGVTVVTLVLVFVGPVSDELRRTTLGFGNRAWIEAGQTVPWSVLLTLLAVHVAAAGALAWTRRGLPPTSFQVIGWVLAVAALPLVVDPLGSRFSDGVLDLLTLLVFPALPVLSVISVTRATAAGARVARDLRSARSKMVEAVEEERRRLRRELHDGLGPALAGVALGVRAAGSQVADAKPATADLLTRLADEVDTCVDEVRRIINDLRPPVLDQLGLAGAIEAQARRVCGAVDGPALSVDLAALEGVRLSAAVELGAFRIAAEAVTNVVRHAQARTCVVRSEVTREGVLLEILDDGRGLPTDPPAGVGLVAMRERAAAVGGGVTLGAGPRGGTAVRAWLARL